MIWMIFREMAQRIVLLSRGEVAFDGDFEALRALAGHTRWLALTTQGAQAPILPNLTHIISEGNLHRYEFDTRYVSVRQAMEAASRVEDLMDLEVLKVPIEQVVAHLYQKWNKQVLE